MLKLLFWIRVQVGMVKINRALPSQTFLPNQEREDINSVSAKYTNDGDFKASVQPDFCVQASPYHIQHNYKDNHKILRATNIISLPAQAQSKRKILWFYIFTLFLLQGVIQLQC